MKRLESDQAPRCANADRGLYASPLRSLDAQPRRSIIWEHVQKWRYIYIIIGMTLYCGANLQARVRGHFDGQNISDESPIPNGTELWTEWLDVCNALCCRT